MKQKPKGLWPQQDIWVKGQVVQRGERNDGYTEARYEPIKRVLQELPGPLRVLDIGAGYGYFSFRLAEELGAHCTMIDALPKTTGVLRQNSNIRVRLIYGKVNASELQEIIHVERPNVILILSVLHHMPDWKEAWRVLLGAGAHIFIEPIAGGEVAFVKRREIAQEMLSMIQREKPVLLAQTSAGGGRTARPIYWIRKRVRDETVRHGGDV